MLHPTGRLIAFAILHQSYSPQTANPYIPILLNVSGKPCCFNSVIWFMMEGLTFSLFSVVKKTNAQNCNILPYVSCLTRLDYILHFPNSHIYGTGTKHISGLLVFTSIFNLVMKFACEGILLSGDTYADQKFSGLHYSDGESVC